MPFTLRLTTVAALTAAGAVLLALAPAAEAQSFRERMQQGGAAIQQGFGKAMTGAGKVVKGAAEHVEDSVSSTTDLMTNEATPEATRAELDAMSVETMNRLFAEQPGAIALFERSAGFAVFDTRKLVLFGLAAGAGRGVAISRPEADTEAEAEARRQAEFDAASAEGRLPDVSQEPAYRESRVYMNMGTAGVGLSLGIGGFQTQVVMLFEDAWRFNAFITQGYDATASAGTMFGDEKAGIDLNFVDGRAIFFLTRQGWKVSATAAGTKYWVDGTLN